MKERCGTIGYLAPEIANEEDYDEKCDIFSLS
jgi:serine/threonine protein kinase